MVLTVQAGQPSQQDSARPVLRTRFRRWYDYAAIAVLVIAVCGGTLTMWWFSDARATVSMTGPSQVSTLNPPETVPSTLTEAWRAASAATSGPVVSGPTVVTGDTHQVVGHDPLTGATRWSYTRNNLELCTVGAAWSGVLAVYHKDRNCSEVTALDATTGQRGAQRNGNAELGTQLLYDGTYVTATGRKVMDTWRSDLVQTQEYGTVTAVVNHDKQPRTNCAFTSESAGPNVIGVIEQCPDEQFPRLTVLKPEGTTNDAEKPNVVFSVQLSAKNAMLVAVTGQLAAVAFPDPARLITFDATGAQRDVHPLAIPDADVRAELVKQVVPTTAANCLQSFGAPGADCTKGGWSSIPGGVATMIYWFTGSSVVALSGDSLNPLWTMQDAIGPGTIFANRLLIPVTSGLAVLDPATGNRTGTIAVNRGDYHGIVQLGSIGPIVLEQRGNTLVALR